MRNKDHIWRLPIDIDYNSLLPAATPCKDLAISIPIFYSRFQNLKEMQTRAYFQQVHVKGAVWASLSILNNSDLGDNGVQVYFHVEEKASKFTLPILKKMGVDQQHIRVLPLDTIYKTKTKFTPKSIQWGKKLMCLYDSSDIKQWIIMDSDLFACTDNPKIELYKYFRSPYALSNCIFLRYFMREIPYNEWIERIYLAIGEKEPTADNLSAEMAAFKKLGFSIDNKTDKDQDIVSRPCVGGRLMLLTLDTPLVAFLKKHIPFSFNEECLFEMYSMFHPVLSLLNNLTALEEYTHIDGYLNGQNTQYLHHIAQFNFDASPYFTRFWRDMTRHIPLPKPARLQCWHNLFQNYGK